MHEDGFAPSLVFNKTSRKLIRMLIPRLIWAREEAAYINDYQLGTGGIIHCSISVISAVKFCSAVCSNDSNDGNASNAPVAGSNPSEPDTSLTSQLRAAKFELHKRTFS